MAFTVGCLPQIGECVYNLWVMAKGSNRMIHAKQCPWVKEFIMYSSIQTLRLLNKHHLHRLYKHSSRLCFTSSIMRQTLAQVMYTSMSV